MTIRLETRFIGNTEYPGAVFPSGIWVGECLLGAEEAKHLNEHMHENQRNLKQEKAEGIAADLDIGAFYLNGETIIVDSNGFTVDGQHRCEGILRSGKPMHTFVVIGVKPQVMPTIDTGTARSFADVLAGLGVNRQNSKLLGRLTKVAYMLDTHGTYLAKGVRTRPTHPQLSEYWDSHSAELALAASVGRTTRARFKPVPPSVAAFAYFIFSRLTPPEADTFMELFATGIGIDRSDHPIYALRERLVNNTRRSVSEKVLSPDEMLALVCRAWNVWRKDKYASTQKLQVTASGRLTSENFPVPR